MESKKNTFLIVFILLLSPAVYSQVENKSKLTIGQIMQDPKWIGHLPENPFWSYDSKTLYFYWDTENNKDKPLYKITAEASKPVKVTHSEKMDLPSDYRVYNKARTKFVYEKNGDLFMLDIKTGQKFQITNTVDYESSPKFSSAEEKIIYRLGYNLFSWNTYSGQIIQLTNIKSGNPTKKEEKQSDQDKWLNNQQLELFDVLKEEKEMRERIENQRKSDQPKRPKEIYTGNKNINDIQLSPDEKYVIFTLFQRADNKNTVIPEFVTESGYTETTNSRSKVGSDFGSFEMKILNIEKDTVYSVQSDSIPGIKELPIYYNEYKKPKPKNINRLGRMGLPVWSDDGKSAFIDVQSNDNKDRWLLLMDPANGKLKLIDRQHDEAWIAGPGISSYGSGSTGWLPDNKKIWFQSEVSGYSHLYLYDITSGIKTQLTSGNFEVYEPFISLDKKFWYFTSNQKHPGERHFYRMPIDGGIPDQITSLEGNNDVSISPDEKKIAVLYSFSNKPWELYVQDNRENSLPKQITHSLSEEFKSYPWRVPELLTFKARDSATVYTRIYVPDRNIKNGAAIVFVHGAGYLQNAHKWWSSYFREYMFNNLLTDNGYMVIDMDYRGSSGYGRDWRTGIYRSMGGKDLTDEVDGVKFLIENYGIDPKKVGIYGGSYGGFITLMAMFKEPEVFTAGAALRSVTDWAHYNHGYTSDILNTPVTDSLAFVKSSPIYFANGLKGHLLMLHGMEDDNVHFQDIVRLSQRLIELKKENWELAVYPVEKHSFVNPSSWTDEYKRIFKFFQTFLDHK